MMAITMINSTSEKPLLFIFFISLFLSFSYFVFRVSQRLTHVSRRLTRFILNTVPPTHTVLNSLLFFYFSSSLNNLSCSAFAHSMALRDISRVRLILVTSFSMLDTSCFNSCTSCFNSYVSCFNPCTSCFNSCVSL